MGTSKQVIPLTRDTLHCRGVCYLTLAEKSYPKRLAFQYLEELQSEFSRLYGRQIDTATRPYAFIKFGEQSAAGLLHPGAFAWGTQPECLGHANNQAGCCLQLPTKPALRSSCKGHS